MGKSASPKTWLGSEYSYLSWGVIYVQKPAKKLNPIQNKTEMLFSRTMPDKGDSATMLGNAE